MDSSFEIVSPDTSHETEFETSMIHYGNAAFILPTEPFVAGQGLKIPISYTASKSHVLGHFVGNPCEWCVQVNPSYYENGKRYISIFLWVNKFSRENKPPEEKSVHAIYQIYVWNQDTKTLNSKMSSIHKFTENRPCFGWKKFMPFPKLKGPLEKQHKATWLYIRAAIRTVRNLDNFVFPSTIEDKYLLKLPNVKINDANSTPCVPASEEEIQKRRKMFVNHQIKERVIDMYTNRTKKNCDTIIRTEKKDHPCHMAILIARTPSRLVPFTTETKGKKELKVVDMKSVPDVVVQAVLEYCYKGYTKYLSNYSMIYKMYTVAAKYNFAGLGKQCLLEMGSTVTPKHFFHVLGIMLQQEATNVPQNMMYFLHGFYFRNHVAIRNSIKNENTKTQAKKMLQHWLGLPG